MSVKSISLALSKSEKLAALPGLSPAESRALRQDVVRLQHALDVAEARSALRAAYAGFSIHGGLRPRHHAPARP